MEETFKNSNTPSNSTNPKNIKNLSPLHESNPNLNQNSPKNTLSFFLMTLEDNNGECKQIKIFEDSDPSELAFYFCKENNLDYSSMKYIESNIEEILNKFKKNNVKELLYLSNDSIKEEEDEEKYGTEETVKSIINDKSQKKEENNKNETTTNKLLLNLINKKITINQLKINTISPMQAKIKDIISRIANGNNYYMIFDNKKNENNNQNKKMTSSIKIKCKKNITPIKKNNTVNNNNHEKQDEPLFQVEEPPIINDRKSESIKIPEISKNFKTYLKDEIKIQKPNLANDLGEYYYQNSLNENNNIINSNGNIININNNNNFNYNYNYHTHPNKKQTHKINNCNKQKNLDFAKKVNNSRYREFLYYMLTPPNNVNSNPLFYNNTNIPKKYKTVYQENINDDTEKKYILKKIKKHNKQNNNKELIGNSYMKTLKKLLKFYLPEQQNKKKNDSKNCNETNNSNNIYVPDNIPRINKCKNMSLNIRNIKKNSSARNSNKISYLNQISKANHYSIDNSKSLKYINDYMKSQLSDLCISRSKTNNSSRNHSKKNFRSFSYRNNEEKKFFSKFAKYKKMNKNISNKKSNTYYKNKQKDIFILDNEDSEKTIKNNNSVNVNTKILNIKKASLSNKDYNVYNLMKINNILKNQNSIKKLNKKRNSILKNSIKSNLTINRTTASNERKKKLQDKKINNVSANFSNTSSNFPSNNDKNGKSKKIKNHKKQII